MNELERDISSLRNQVKKLENINNLLMNELNFFEKIYENAPEPMILLDEKKRFIDANPAACRFFEIEYEQLLTKSMFDFLYMSPADIIEAQDQQLEIKGTLTAEWLIELKNGNVRQVEFYAISKIKDQTDLYILKDITSRKRLEWERSMHFQLFNKIFNQVIDGIIMFDESGTIVSANPAFCKSIGKEIDQLMGINLQTLFVKENKSDYMKFWREFSLNGSFFGEIQIGLGGDARIYEMSTSSDVFNGLNMSILRDVTERKMMKVELQYSEEKFRKVFHETMDGILLWKESEQDHQIELIEINNAGKDILNIEKNGDIFEELKKMLVLPPTDHQDIITYLKASLKDEKKKALLKLRFTNHPEKNIEYYTVSNILPGFHLTNFCDVTEKIQMEEQLRQSETLNVVGELAAGIAHEIRNPMTSLKGFIQLLKTSIDGYEMYFDIISSEIERIETIVSQMLVLAKPQAIQYKEENVVSILEKTMELLNAQAVLENVQLMKHFNSDEILVYCEPNQLKQVFINIIKNAIEVMPDGGRVSFHTAIEKDFVKISIQDNGPGISPENLHTIGKPFFTTKESGTGLGLRVSYKIVEEHGGKITVESKLGEGSVFHIFLPLHKPKNEA